MNAELEQQFDRLESQREKIERAQQAIKEIDDIAVEPFYGMTNTSEPEVDTSHLSGSFVEITVEVYGNQHALSDFNEAMTQYNWDKSSVTTHGSEYRLRLKKRVD